MQYSFYNKRVHKLVHYLRTGLCGLLSRQLGGKRVAQALARYHAMNAEERAYVERRVSYYNRLNAEFSAESAANTVATYRRSKSWSYHLDFKPLIHCFPQSFRFDYQFGDVTEILNRPTFVKSRPVAEGYENANNVLLKLNRIRHYYIPRDPFLFEQKKALAVWRGSAHRDKRKHFVEQCYNIPGCNIADVSEKSLGKPWHGEFMSIKEQLKYRFIISVEGNDVATNLKWIMASNSLCLMPQPEYETWFMEGALVPDKHYVALCDDYADLQEKIEYYTYRPKEAQMIIDNAKDYVAQFMDEEREFLIALLVMDKYFFLSGQGSVLGLECQ